MLLKFIKVFFVVIVILWFLKKSNKQFWERKIIKKIWDKIVSYGYVDLGFSFNFFPIFCNNYTTLLTVGNTDIKMSKLLLSTFIYFNLYINNSYFFIIIRLLTLDLKEVR